MMTCIYFIDEKQLAKLTQTIDSLNRYSKQDLVEFGIDVDVGILCGIHKELIANKITEDQLCEHIKRN